MCVTKPIVNSVSFTRSFDTIKKQREKDGFVKSEFLDSKIY
ncbi:hypothetical protein LEP1GSC038_4027 [Leptospira weilii str. 2006001855]|uniref:Uncharacterized protein n=1 Tax=Leptospira weilii str. 2006001855 TaxID=996804 RepID=M6FYH3_9LEPT|nr:hypothetical protein LEP1GSC038_4027 [Leptospira weilii str. 2006001855]